jgi:hypothetical protein
MMEAIDVTGICKVLTVPVAFDGAAGRHVQIKVLTARDERLWIDFTGEAAAFAASLTLDEWLSVHLSGVAAAQDADGRPQQLYFADAAHII